MCSNALNGHQRNYCAREKEAWGLVAATRKWRAYCRAAIRICLVTDHCPLEWLREQKDPRGKFGRWLLELEEFNYEIVSRNGLEHVVPDCLSRSTFTERDTEIMNDEQFFENRIFAVNCESNEMWLSRVHDMQLDDPAIRLARQQLHTNNEIREGRYKRFKLMHVDKGILMRGRQVVVPNNLRYEITKACHESTGHLGEPSTLAAVSEKCVEWYRGIYFRLL